MCGIGVLVASTRSTLDITHRIQPFLSLVRHRGPDDEGFALVYPDAPLIHGYWGSDTPENVRVSQWPGAGLRPLESSRPGANVALGHRRLSIVDVSASGHQPMVSQDGQFAIVFNGEVYNFETIRQELEERHHLEFRSHSDTEVLLAAYSVWGTEALNRFNGMFALAIYDARKRRLFAARDRFGVKPLYLWFSPDGVLALASELKQLTALPSFRPTMNAQRAFDFLNWGLTDHTNETLFEGVQQLRGGEFIEFDVDRLSGLPLPTRWYELKPRGSPPIRFEDAAAEVRELVLDSVRLRMRADVPIGTALSGGLDSSSIVCAVDANLRLTNSTEQQRTFSACSHIARYDERQHIERVVAATRVAPHYVFPSVADLLQSLESLTWHQDEPFGGTSIFAEWSVYRTVATTPVKVTLDGHGADELFAGYPTFFGPRLLELLSSAQLLEFARASAALQRRHHLGPAGLIGSLLNSALPNEVLQWLRAAAGKVRQDATWFRHDRFSIDPSPPWATYFRQSKTLQGYSMAQLLATSLPMQLHWADRDSMAHSVESRTPFLDYRLVEFVLGCPSDFKLRDGITKAVLRTAMSNIIPPAIATRPDKMGFVTAEQHWMLSEATAEFQRELEVAFETASSVLNHEARLRGLAILKGDEPFNLFVWRLISFGRWLSQFRVAT